MNKNKKGIPLLEGRNQIDAVHEHDYRTCFELLAPSPSPNYNRAIHVDFDDVSDGGHGTPWGFSRESDTFYIRYVRNIDKRTLVYSNTVFWSQYHNSSIGPEHDNSIIVV